MFAYSLVRWHQLKQGLVYKMDAKQLTCWILHGRRGCTISSIWLYSPVAMYIPVSFGKKCIFAELLNLKTIMLLYLDTCACDIILVYSEVKTHTVQTPMFTNRYTHSSLWTHACTLYPYEHLQDTEPVGLEIIDKNIAHMTIVTVFKCMWQWENINVRCLLSSCSSQLIQKSELMKRDGQYISTKCNALSRLGLFSA